MIHAPADEANILDPMLISTFGAAARHTLGTTPGPRRVTPMPVDVPEPGRRPPGRPPKGMRWDDIKGMYVPVLESKPAESNWVTPMPVDAPAAADPAALAAAAPKSGKRAKPLVAPAPALAPAAPKSNKKAKMVAAAPAPAPAAARPPGWRALARQPRGASISGLGSTGGLEAEVGVQTAAALLDDAAHSPMNAWGFVGQSDCGRGLFARADLVANQFIAEYTGPRLPGRLQTTGSYVLQIPGANDVIIDGASENSPFRCPCSPAIYANHSSAPNARLEMWPAPRPGSLELRQHMVLVASEPIAAGQEVRINYEHMDGTYWRGAPPAETAWRELHVSPPPPPTREQQPVISRLIELQAAAASGHTAPPCAELREHGAPLRWEGEEGGDVRLRVLVPLLATKSYGHGGVLSRIAYNWAMVATHLPGRSGRECRDRWLTLTRAAMAEAQADGGSDDDGSGEHRERCMVLGCKHQLVCCHGVKEAGSAVGIAEESHVLCAPCLERWFVSQNELRREKELPDLVRRSCPVCQVELRAVRGEEGFHLGLRKVGWSWDV